MIKLGINFPDCKLTLVHDEDYYSTAKTMISQSFQFVYASIFIVELAPDKDKSLIVDSILYLLREAIWRGVDVKLLIGGSRTNFKIANICDAARTRALSLGIPCKLLASFKARGSHVKMILADHFVLTGSHNLSPGALTNHIQDSIFVQSSSMSAFLKEKFFEQWNRAEIQNG